MRVSGMLGVVVLGCFGFCNISVLEIRVLFIKIVDSVVRSMFNASGYENREEDVVSGKVEEVQELNLNIAEELNSVEKEVCMLQEEKENLMKIEKELWYKISEEMERRKQKKESLKKEIEELKRRCEELTKILNALIQE